MMQRHWAFTIGLLVGAALASLWWAAAMFSGTEKKGDLFVGAAILSIIFVVAWALSLAFHLDDAKEARQKKEKEQAYQFSRLEKKVEEIEKRGEERE